MQEILNRFSRMVVHCGRIVINDSDLGPEKPKIEMVKFLKCIEQMHDPTVLQTYYIVNGNISTNPRDDKPYTLDRRWHYSAAGRI